MGSHPTLIRPLVGCCRADDVLQVFSTCLKQLCLMELVLELALGGMPLMVALVTPRVRGDLLSITSSAWILS